MREPFFTGEFYHVFCRGVDKRDIYIDDQDRRRFLHCLEKSNNPQPLKETSSPFIEIIAFCLMGNHFHLLVKQRTDKGLSRFCQRALNAYVRYFNIRHSRSGRLFETPFKSVHVSSDAQLFAVFRYIHLNPVEIIIPGWKESAQLDFHTAQTFLSWYPWSSYRHYLNQDYHQFIDRASLGDFSAEQCQNLIESRLTPGVYWG